MKKLFILYTILSLNLVYASDDSQVGKVTLLKGDALIKGSVTSLSLGSSIKEGDVLITRGKSVLRIKFSDNTVVSLGPNSIFRVKKYRMREGKRINVLNFLRGKIRAQINQKRKDGETIIFSNAEVSLGVRGTVILANSYLVNGAASTDVMLTKGAVDMNLSKLGTDVKSFKLEPGKAFNSNLFREKGISSIKSISSKALKLISSGDGFLPNIQNLDGSFIELSKSIGSLPVPVPAAIGVLASAVALKSKALAPMAAKKKNEEVIASSGFMYVLKNEPWDIRDAVINSKKNRAHNNCFYFFYKTIPGSGEFERFRRTRACDEFENELD